MIWDGSERINMAKQVDPIVQRMIEKTVEELSGQPKEKRQDSRNWKDPEGYRYLFPWSNAVLLRYFIRKFTDSLPKKEFRRKTQFDDAGSSVVRNIEEGFKRPTTKEYLFFLGFSQASLEECKGNTRESTDDGLLKSVPGSSLEKLRINLRDFRDSLLSSKTPLQSFSHPLMSSKGSLEETRGKLKDFSYHPLTVLYPPLNSIRAEDLTYEVFMELINKTDYLLRQLVVSLEKKLAADQKGYQIEQVRLNRKAKGN